MSLTEAVEELRSCSGTQFDPRVVDAIIAVLGDRGAVPALRLVA
jgi:HD-GYP domain-containing protein (c-di-GMP phosphodiesterase class II)